MTASVTVDVSRCNKSEQSVGLTQEFIRIRAVLVSLNEFHIAKNCKLLLMFAVLDGFSGQTCEQLSLRSEFTDKSCGIITDRKEGVIALRY